MARRRRSWRPPDRSAHLDLPAAPSIVASGHQVRDTSGWSSDPGDSIVVYRPRCGRCQKPAMVWQRCRCGTVFARCNDHDSLDGGVRRERASHRCATSTPT